MNSDQAALELHRTAQGKVKMSLTTPITTLEDLALTYTPGVAAPARAIAKREQDV